MHQYNLNENNIAKAVVLCTEALIIPGSFLLVPTETVYGLVCSWNDTVARNNIYTAKNRPEQKPFQMLVDSLDMVKKQGGIISDITSKIVEHFCPGPITLIIPSKDNSTIGFRMPEYNFIHELITHHAFPLAGTSANLSGNDPALEVGQALNELKLEPNVVIDGGIIPSTSLASTVVRVDGSNLEVLREGPVSLEAIKCLLGSHI